MELDKVLDNVTKDPFSHGKSELWPLLLRDITCWTWDGDIKWDVPMDEWPLVKQPDLGVRLCPRSQQAVAAPILQNLLLSPWLICQDEIFLFQARMSRSIVCWKDGAREIHRHKNVSRGDMPIQRQARWEGNAKCLIDFKTATRSCLGVCETVKKIKKIKYKSLKRTRCWWGIGSSLCAGCLFSYKATQMRNVYPMENPWRCVSHSEPRTAHSPPAGALQNTFLTHPGHPHPDATRTEGARGTGDDQGVF